MTTPTTVQVRLQLRADTAANWTLNNPVLLANELGRETDTGKIKIGNGSTAWSSLAYQPFGGQITNADIAANAEIAVSKLADGAARQLLQTDAAGTGVEWASNIDVPGTLDVTGAATFDAAVTIQGDLTVNGTTTTIDTANLAVEDKNIEIGKVASPTDVTADGGGITLRGTTDKTINWVDATDAWTFSEHVNIASGKEYRINGVKVLDGTSLGTGVTGSSLTSVGTIGTGVWQGTTIGTAYGGSGQTTYSNGQLLIGKTDGTLAKATLTAGTGVAVTNADGSVTVAVDSTVVTTAQTGTVTSTMIADGTIVNADVNASAAIAGTKISPDFGSQTVQTTGIFSHALGTATAPTVTFTGDTNTGIFSPGADQLAISTNGTGRATIDSSGRLLVGTSSPLNVGGNAGFEQFQLAGLGASFTRFANSGNSPVLTFAKSRGTTTGENTVVNSGDAIGQIFFSGADGTGYVPAALIQASVDGTPGTGAMPGRLVFSTTPSGSGTPTERMRLDSSGRLGLGTSSPATQLHIEGNPANITLRDTDAASNGYFQIGARGGAGDLAILDVDPNNVIANSVFAINVDNTERLRITAAGNVGIGTTSPGANLDIAGATFANIFLTDIAAGASGAIYGDGGAIDLRVNNSTDNAFTVTTGSQRFRVSGSERARIDSSGRLLVGTSTSVARGMAYPVQIDGTTDVGLQIGQWSNSTTPPFLIFSKSRATTVGGTGTISNGDVIGDVGFRADDGSGGSFLVAANIRCQVDGTPGANDMPGRLVFSTTADGASSPTERMRIANNGRIFAGATGTYTSRFNVLGESGENVCSFANPGTGGIANFFANSTTEVGFISVSASATTYSTSSDYRLKENIVPLTGAVDRLQQIPVHRFNFIADPGTTVDGFIAHEAQAVVPECVTGTKDEVDEDGNPVYQGIDQSKLVPLLTAALQEALQKIEDLEGRLTAAGL